MFIEQILAQNNKITSRPSIFVHPAHTMHCLKQGLADIVELLIEKGADVQAPDNDGWTPLMPASSEGHVEVVRILLEKEEDVHASNNSGSTPLILASSENHLHVARMLFEKGAEAHGTEPRWVGFASIHGHTEMVNLLLGRS